MSRVQPSILGCAGTYSRQIRDLTLLRKHITHIVNITHFSLLFLTKPNDYYLFSHDCMPGREHVGADQFNKRWREMRSALGWSSRYQFYSLKDSGIRDLADAEGITVARDQARHADISTTNKYVQQHMAPEASKHFKGSLKTDVE